MPFSLYGDLPEPSSEKAADTKSTSASTTTLSGLYASLPAPGAASTTEAALTPKEESAPVTTSTTTPIVPPAQSSPAKPAGIAIGDLVNGLY